MAQVRYSFEAADNAIAAGAALRSLVRRLARQPFSVVGRWMERSRQRRALANLDDWALRDIGISRAEAEHEIATPFWR